MIDFLINSNFKLLKFFFKRVKLLNIIEDSSLSELDNKLFLELNASPFFSLTVGQIIILAFIYYIFV